MTNLSNILDQFKPDNSIFRDEDDRTNKIQNIIFNNLTEPERRVILLYAEHQSIRKVSQLLNISIGLTHLYIQNVRTKILNELKCS